MHTHIGVNMRVRSCVHIKGGASTEEVCIGDEGLVTSNLKDESPLLSTLEVSQNRIPLIIVRLLDFLFSFDVYFRFCGIRANPRLLFY